ncbi:hypothetical protein RND71_042544 [Anisodus tanguticus]|uniref:Calmodulin-binding domain-containing protein n=1 Tax=Anisodus tanguticus TaxID=243964 RepID=A0AAE1QTW7_9SOLA|nr:hypothetical protein RND71_042544 [Anisodus tanguticus]
MATRTRDTAPSPAGKEKRGTSSIHHQRSTANTSKTTSNTSKTTSPLRKQVDPTSTTGSLNRNPPSYLKPTITQAKKSASSSDLHNTRSTKTSNLTRRRSFDNNPPLPSSLPKTRISPSPGERIPRSSSSLSAKISTSHRTLLDKSSKTTTSKDAIGKQRGAGLNSRPVTKKKTTTTTTKTRNHDSANGLTTKASVTTNSPDIAHENNISQGEQSEPEDHQELTIHETEKETIISDNEMIADSYAGENENDHSATEDHIEELHENVNSAELEDIKAAAELVENQETKIEEPEEISNEPNEPDSSEKEKEETIINASSEENQESEEEDEGTNQEKETPMVEEIESLSPKQVGVGVEESTKAEPAKSTSVASSKCQHQVVQGKNTESVVSNNVIEETASKLREQRKNKVRALAGAFETVISLQEHK